MYCLVKVGYALSWTLSQTTAASQIVRRVALPTKRIQPNYRITVIEINGRGRLVGRRPFGDSFFLFCLAGLSGLVAQFWDSCRFLSIFVILCQNAKIR